MAFSPKRSHQLTFTEMIQLNTVSMQEICLSNFLEFLS